MSCSCDNNPLILPVGATGATGPKGDTGAGAFEHYIGEEFGGGVVFHVYRDANGTEHGLIVSTIDIAVNKQYSNVTAIEIGVTAQSSWDGASNTTAISTQVGVTAGAGKECADYSGGGFTDWYLPSYTEIFLFYTNRFNVHKTLSTIAGATEFDPGEWYWTSTEASSTDAFRFNPNGPSTSVLAKTNLSSVRAIRKY
jgi:hypothetical protein